MFWLQNYNISHIILKKFENRNFIEVKNIYIFITR